MEVKNKHSDLRELKKSLKSKYGIKIDIVNKPDKSKKGLREWQQIKLYYPKKL